MWVLFSDWTGEEVERYEKYDDAVKHRTFLNTLNEEYGETYSFRWEK